MTICFNTPPQDGEWRLWIPILLGRYLNCAGNRALMKRSTSWCCEDTCIVLRQPTCIFSWIRWWSISMCFVLSWKTGLAAIWRVASLSQNSVIGSLLWILKSRRRVVNQISSQVTLAIARYPTLAEDRETMPCFLDFHEIKESPRKTQKPLMDLLISLQAPQSESAEALRWIDDVA